MPFAKSNWECDPAIPNGGFFEFGQLCIVKGLALTKGDHRPCFLHVSSEVECVVKALSVVASVEILDLYALVGPMDSFDYRHIAKLQGTPTDPSIASYAFRIDPSVIPREKVWQIQLKLSSGAQSISRITLHEMTVQVERSHPDRGGASEVVAGPGRRISPRLTSGAGDTLGMSSSAALSSSFRAGGAEDDAVEASWSTASLLTSRKGASTSRSSAGGAGLGGSTSLAGRTTSGALSSSGRASGGGIGTSSGGAGAGLGGSSSGLSGSSSGLSGSSSRLARDSSSTGNLPPPPPRMSSSSRGSSSSGRTSSSSSRTGLVARSGSMGMTRSGHRSSTRDMAPLGGAGGGQMQLREETAAVASVLNAVCEKMVGVVSDKTKNYLFRAGRRTERKVLDKMQRLEERIERFDQVLERSSIKKIGEIEDAVLSLDSQLKFSPATAAPTPTSSRSS